MNRFTRRVLTGLVSASLLAAGAIVAAAPASAQTGIAYGGTSCEHKLSDAPDVFYPAFVVSATSDDQSTITVYGGSDPNNLTPYVIPVSTTQIDYPIDLTSLGTGTTFYFKYDAAVIAPDLIGPVPDCSYDPSSARVTAVISALTCVDGTWYGNLAVTSTNHVYGEDIDFQVDTVTQPGFPTFSDYESTWDFPFSLPVNTTVGPHTYTVINRGVLIHTEPFTVASGCDATTPLPVIYTAPSITGSPVVGNQLTCGGATYSPNVNSVTYGWPRNGVLIDGATQDTYTLVAADAGTMVSCKVTVSDGITSVSATSPAVAVASAPQLPVRTSGPTRVGVLRVGSVQTCNVTYTGALSNTFAWKANGVLIPGANKRTFTLTYYQLNKHITCLTSASNAGGTTPTVSSVSSVVVALGPALKVLTKPSISGTSSPGKTLTAKAGGWSPAATSYKYQWQVLKAGKYVNISRATARTYKVPKAYDNKYLRVVVTALKAGYNKGVYASARVYI